MEAYTLFEVNEHVKQVIALNFQEAIWVECEISQLKEVRGQVYLDLIEKNEDSNQLIAQSQAVIWYKEYLFIKKKLGDLLGGILTDGVKVKLKVLVEFHEKYGLKLVIQDIDPSYTMGMFELAKQKIIERIRKEGLMDLNAQLHLPDVIQSIAVISSEKAAGYQDFIKQLDENIYDYDFRYTLFPAAMQGQNTEREIVAQLKEINEHPDRFNLIIIARGGGSKADLASFDNYNIAAAIAKSHLPVLTGIGHDIDETVADLVAYDSLKTPTAVANFIIEHNMRYEADLNQLELMLINASQQVLMETKESLMDIQNIIFRVPSQIIADYRNDLAKLDSELLIYTQNIIGIHKSELNQFADLIKVLTPENILKRGFTLVRQGDKIVISKKALNAKEEFEIVFKDGELKGLTLKD